MLIYLLDITWDSLNKQKAEQHLYNIFIHPFNFLIETA